MTSFLRNQMRHAIRINKPKTSVPPSLSICSATAVNSIPRKEHFWNLLFLASQTSLAAGHSHKMWDTVLASLWHRGHKGSFTTFLRNKLSLVGNMFRHARHIKCFAACRITNFQSIYQTSLSLALVKHSGCFLFSISLAIRYSLLTKKMPLVVRTSPYLHI